MRIVSRFPVFTSSQIHPQCQISALPAASSPDSDSFHRSQSKTSGKAIKFGTLVKISGTGAYRDTWGIPIHTLEESLEFAKQHAEEPGVFDLGYYQDPEKPDNVWMADDDAMRINTDKTTLDNALRESAEKFKEVFKLLKKERGQKNVVRRLIGPNKREERRPHPTQFVNVSKTKDGFEMAGYYKDHPEKWEYGYYQDPKKPDEVWMAAGDAKFLLDRAIRNNLTAEFEDTFIRLKKKHGSKLKRAMSHVSGSSVSNTFRSSLNDGDGSRS